jgi:hypothetical protein
LTKLVKPGVISRAKIAAIGILPSFQTGHCLLPASDPFTFNGLKGVTPFPTSGPDFNSPPKPLPAITPATTKEARYLFIKQAPG